MEPVHSIAYLPQHICTLVDPPTCSTQLTLFSLLQVVPRIPEQIEVKPTAAEQAVEEAIDVQEAEQIDTNEELADKFLDETDSDDGG